MLTKRNDHTLSAYRRHQPKCPLKGQPDKIQGCQCPLYAQGKIHGEYVRKGLNTRDAKVALALIEQMLNPPTGPHGGGLAVMPKPGLMTLELAGEEFLKSKGKSEDAENGKAKNGKASNTLTLYERAVTHFNQWAKTHSLSLLTQIDTPQIQAYFRQYEPDWELSTCQSRLTHLRVWFNYCGPKKRRWINFVPTSDPDLNYKKPGQAQRKPFKPYEVTQILAACERMPEKIRDRARALVYLLLFTGMRISDATFFERSYVKPNLNGGSDAEYYVIKTRRMIDLAPELQKRLLDALSKLPDSRVYYFQPDREGDYREARYALEKGQEFEPLMPDYKARVRAATKLVRNVLKEAGLTGGCHRFRDTFAVNLLTATDDIFAVSQMLGHSDIKITKIYIKLVPGYQERLRQKTRQLSYVFPEAA